MKAKCLKGLRWLAGCISVFNLLAIVYATIMIFLGLHNLLVMLLVMCANYVTFREMRKVRREVGEQLAV